MTDLRDRLNTLADEARTSAGQIAEEAHDEGKAAVVELHQITRKVGGKVKEAAEETHRRS